MSTLMDLAAELHKQHPELFVDDTMEKPTIYRIVTKDGNQVRQMRDTFRVACFMLGRRLDAYIIIKSDKDGDRVVSFTSSDVAVIEQDLKAA